MKHILAAAFVLLLADHTRANGEKYIFQDRLVDYVHCEILNPQELKASAGFIHAIDSNKLQIQSIEQAELSRDIQTDRIGVRNGLENLNEPVNRLIKTYLKTLLMFDGASNKDTHEALHKEYCRMEPYGKHKEVLIRSL